MEPVSLLPCCEVREEEPPVGVEVGVRGVVRCDLLVWDRGLARRLSTTMPAREQDTERGGRERSEDGVDCSLCQRSMPVSCWKFD